MRSKPQDLGEFFARESWDKGPKGVWGCFLSIHGQPTELRSEVFGGFIHMGFFHCLPPK